MAGQTSQIDVQLAGLNKPVLPFVTNLTYTALNQPKAWAWNHGLAGLPPLTASRSFDAHGRMTSNEFASYSFDAASRITSFGRNNASSSTSYTYDANSNRLSSINTTTSDTDQDGDFDAVDFSKTTSQALSVAAGSNKLQGFSQTLTTQRTNAQGNPITAATSSQITYSLDANGNLTSDGLRLFEYDGQNRLAKVLVSQSAEASKITYLHNALGQRVFKSEPQVAQTAPDEATLGQSYIYSDDNLGSTPVLLGEYGNGGNKSAGRIEYLYLPTEDPSTGSGQAAMPIGLMKANRFYAIHADHLNTPRLIRDDSHKPVWQWAYSAFGDNKPSGLLKATPNPKVAITNQPVLLKATNPLEINLRYPGQYFDEESNLNYNYFRSYQPTQGRYTQSDPIGLDGGWNRFSYVGGNPLSYVDPPGLDATNWNNTSGGKSRWEFPTNGNWGGKCWSGGQYSCGGNSSGNAPPLDSGDACYQRHDSCYDKCGSNSQCVRTCDRQLVDELRRLPTEPAQWPQPPRPGTEGDSKRYRNTAIEYFK